MSDSYCFGCGEKNPIGLKLSFEFDGDRIFTTKTLAREFEGYAGRVHGGIVSTLFDETMCKFISAKYGNSVTGKLEVRFKSPTPTGKELRITAWEEKRRQNIVMMGAQLEVAGKITAEATAKFALEKWSGS